MIFRFRIYNQRVSKLLRIGSISVLLLLNVALSQENTSADSPDKSQETSDTLQNQTASGSVLAKKVESLFKSGDAIELAVYPDTTSFPNGVYPINDQGFAYFPVLGYKKVAGKSAKTLEKLLKEAYVDFLPRPNIQVRPLIRVSLMGGFFQPGLYWIDPKENLWNCIKLAGGTGREDGLEKIRWRRSNITISKELIPYIESGRSLEEIGFKSGDQLLVTRRPKQQFWEVFRTDVLPVLTVTLSAVASAATAYIAYETFQDRQ